MTTFHIGEVHSLTIYENSTKSADPDPETMNPVFYEAETTTPHHQNDDRSAEPCTRASTSASVVSEQVAVPACSSMNVDTTTPVEHPEDGTEGEGRTRGMMDSVHFSTHSRWVLVLLAGVALFIILVVNHVSAADAVEYSSAVSAFISVIMAMMNK
nr:hypothetical protein [Streptomyces sp. 846.5]